MHGESILVWLIVGGIAGWLGGLITKGGGFGIFGDIVVGIVGSVIGGWLFGTYYVGTSGIAGAIIGATIGAVVLLLVIRLIRQLA